VRHIDQREAGNIKLERLGERANARLRSDQRRNDDARLGRLDGAAQRGLIARMGDRDAPGRARGSCRSARRISRACVVRTCQWATPWLHHSQAGKQRDLYLVEDERQRKRRDEDSGHDRNYKSSA